MAGHLYIPDLKRAANEQVWFRYRQLIFGEPEIRIKTLLDALVKTIDGLGDRPAGTYASRSRAIFWNRRNTGGSLVASGTYFAELYIDSSKESTMKIILP
jgi:hypothetical protein